MSDKQQSARQPAAAKRGAKGPKASARRGKALNEQELDKVSGGITITKTQDQASPSYTKT